MYSLLFEVFHNVYNYQPSTKNNTYQPSTKNNTNCG